MPAAAPPHPAWVVASVLSQPMSQCPASRDWYGSALGSTALEKPAGPPVSRSSPAPETPSRPPVPRCQRRTRHAAGRSSARSMAARLLPRQPLVCFGCKTKRNSGSACSELLSLASCTHSSYFPSTTGLGPEAGLGSRALGLSPEPSTEENPMVRGSHQLLSFLICKAEGEGRQYSCLSYSFCNT